MTPKEEKIKKNYALFEDFWGGCFFEAMIRTGFTTALIQRRIFRKVILGLDMKSVTLLRYFVRVFKYR